LRAFVVDDEPLAVRRMVRMLEESGRVTVAGSTSDPAQALTLARSVAFDVLFLDIEMPGMTGFDLLARLPGDPLVVFTTAYNQYALKAFEVNSVDYLLKPVEPVQLDRALGKLERILQGAVARPGLRPLLDQLADALAARRPAWIERIPSRVGERVEFVEVSRVTHFFARDKLTFAATATRSHAIDLTITELESRLDPAKFVRIHRSTIVNLDFVLEMHLYFAGKLLLRLRDEKRTELTVARDRVKELKERLGLTA